MKFEACFPQADIRAVAEIVQYQAAVDGGRNIIKKIEIFSHPWWPKEKIY